MAFSIVWSPNALQDMEELYDFYAEKNLNAAARIHNQIIDEVVLLENNPMLGALEETLKHRVKAYRSLVVSNGRFKALYFIENETIFIAGIWNCKQNPEKMESMYK